MAVDHNNPQSRNEEILIATIDGKEYNKLPQSRIEELLLELKEVIEEGGGGGGGIRPIGVTTTPLYDGAITNPIQINGESYTAETGDMVTYQSTEFLFNVNEVWQELGDVSVVLAIIDNIFADIAPAFSASSTYAAGDYVIYNDQLYKCTTAHTGAWDENNFTATTISNEIADVETALADKVNKVDGKELSTNDYDDTEKAAVAAATSAISAMKDGTGIDSFGDVEIALLDKADISDLGTAAAKDSTNSVTSGSTDLVESGAVKDAIDAAVSSAYHHAGTKTVAQLTHDLLIAANEGNVYNIIDSGTTTSDFIEGIGKTINEGSNVGICKVGNAYMFDLLSGFVDTTNFVQKSETSGLLKNDGTVNDEIEGDIDSLKSGFTNLDNEVNGDATTYPYADVITIEDAVPANVADCNVKIEPVQDLHGQSAPYVGGAGKNKCILLLDRIKAENTAETWNGNVYVHNGVTITVQTDNDGNVTGIKLYGVCTSDFTFYLFTNESITFDTDTIINGREGALNVTLRVNTDAVIDTSTGATIPANTEITRVDARIKTSSQGTAIDATLYPMIRLSTETDATFAPYTNICPISGHTEASVQRDGKNLLDIPDKTLSSSGWAIEQYSPISVKAGTYTLSYDFSGTANSSSLVFYDENKVEIARGNATSTINGRNTSKVVLPQKAYYFNMYSNAVGTYTNFMFESGEDATPYEPYAGKTYTIALGDTIYGGTVDFDSGVMTVTHGIVEFDGTETWNGTQYDGQYFTIIENRYKPVSRGNKPNFKCSQYSIGNATLTNADPLNNGEISSFGDTTQNNIIFVRNTDCSTTAEIKTAMDGVQLCYELATPFTIQLTPTQIQLLKGQNTLTASTGQISVTVNGVSGAIWQVQEQVNELRTDLSKGYLVKTFNVEGHANDTSIDFSALKPSDYNGFVNAYSCNGSGAVIQKCKNDVIYFVEALGVDATITIVYTVSQ